MNSLTKITFAFVMSFNISAIAAETGNTTEQRDKNLNRRHSGETMEMRGCLERKGNDKEVCGEEMLNNQKNSTSSEGPRRNQNTNSKMRDDMKSKELDIRDIKPSESLPSGTQSNDTNTTNSTGGKIEINSSSPSNSGTVNSDISKAK